MYVVCISSQCRKQLCVLQLEVQTSDITDTDQAKLISAGQTVSKCLVPSLKRMNRIDVTEFQDFPQILYQNFQICLLILHFY